MSEVTRIAWSQWGGGALGLVASFIAVNFFLARAIGRTIGSRRLELVDTMSVCGGQ
jgi:hypothetical protein